MKWPKNNEKRPGVNFINVFTREFFVRTYVLAAFSNYVLALVKNSYEKFARLTLMKLTPAGQKIAHSYSYELVRTVTILPLESRYPVLSVQTSNGYVRERDTQNKLQAKVFTL
jgi:hypothetical protein